MSSYLLADDGGVLVGSAEIENVTSRSATSIPIDIPAKEKTPRRRATSYTMESFSTPLSAIFNNPDTHERDGVGVSGLSDDNEDFTMGAYVDGHNTSTGKGMLVVGSLPASGRNPPAQSARPSAESSRILPQAHQVPKFEPDGCLMEELNGDEISSILNDFSLIYDCNPTIGRKWKGAGKKFNIGCSMRRHSSASNFSNSSPLCTRARRATIFIDGAVDESSDDGPGEAQDHVGYVWNIANLESLTNCVRAALENRCVLGGSEFEQVDSLVDKLFRDNRAKEPVDDEFFEVVLISRIDKLLEALQSGAGFEHIPYDGLHSIAAKAAFVNDSLRRRFHEDFAKITYLRTTTVKDKYLNAIEMAIDTKSKQPAWRPKLIKSGMDGTGMLGHKPGEWFIDPVVAYAEGLISTPTGELCSSGSNGEMTSLCLLDGFEVEANNVDDNSRIVKYVRQGEQKLIASKFLLHLGNTVRLLRGHGLNSRYAPRAGLRFDGLYKISQYGLKLDAGTDSWTATITLGIVDGPSPGDLVSVPSPSQIDDFQTFKNIEAREVIRLVGSAAYQQWKITQR